MISICTPIYPWYMEHDRLCDLFDALIPSIGKMKQKHKLQFSLVDNGTRDIWGLKRKHNAEIFRRKIAEYFSKIEVKFIYSLKDNFVKLPDGRVVWHLSKTLDDSIKQSTGKDLFIAGADLILPENFVELFEANVKKGKEVWIPHCYNLLRGQEWKIPANPHFLNGWRTARGIHGFTRYDYKAVGGYPIHRPGFRVGIDATILKKFTKKFKLNEFKCKGLFHLHHVGSKAIMPGKIEK